MRHLKKFKEIDPVNEGFKEAIIGGLFSILMGIGYGQAPEVGNSKIDSKHHTTTIKRKYSERDSVKMEKDVQRLLKDGWKQSYEQIDTLWSKVSKESPDTEIESLSLKIDNELFFASGKFELSDEIKSSIDSALQNIIEMDGVLIGVEIVSSTDKQRLSQGLQDRLKSMKLSPDNKGLSIARSNGAKSYLISSGINDTLIKVTNFHEMGENDIDQSSRYVYINFNYLISPDLPKTSSGEKDFKTKKTLYFTKDFKTKVVNPKHRGGGVKSKIIKHGKVIGKRKPLPCPSW